VEKKLYNEVILITTMQYTVILNSRILWSVVIIYWLISSSNHWDMSWSLNPDVQISMRAKMMDKMD